jgi:hypothetical protein
MGGLVEAVWAVRTYISKINSKYKFIEARGLSSVRKNQQMDAILDPLNPVHNITPHLLKIHFGNIVALSVDLQSSLRILRYS